MNQPNGITMFMAYVLAFSPYLFGGIGFYWLWKFIKQIERDKQMERRKARRRARIAEESKLKIRMIQEMYEGK